MPFMRFSNAKQVIFLALAWTGAMVYVDYIKNPRPLKEMYLGTKHTKPDQKIATPHVSLLITHLCCSGCLDDVRAALQKLPWVGTISIPDEAALPGQENSTEKEGQNYAGWVDVTIKDLKLVDFVELNRVLYDTGLTAGKIKFSGLNDYRLEATFKHICCQVCSKALDKGLGFDKGLRNNAPLQWLDNVHVSKEHRTVTMAPRLGRDAEISELFEVLHKLGFAPSSMRLALSADQMKVTMVHSGGDASATGTPGAAATPGATPGTAATPGATPGTAATPGTPPAATPAAPAGAATATIDGTEVKLSQPLHFAAGEIKLNDQSAAVLQALAKAVQADPGITELIMKVAASGADKKAAKKLATERAAELKKILTEAGIPHKALKIHAHHEPGEDAVIEVTVSRKKHHEHVEEDSQ